MYTNLCKTTETENIEIIVLKKKMMLIKNSIYKNDRVTNSGFKLKGIVCSHIYRYSDTIPSC